MSSPKQTRCKEEVEEVNKRLYYKVLEHDRLVSTKLDVKYSDTLKQRPVTASLTKESLDKSLEKLYTGAVRNKESKRAELFRKLVTDKEPRIPPLTADALAANIKRLYVVRT